MAINRETNGRPNFNNMTDEQRQEWHTVSLAVAEHENYVNRNLELVRQIRTQAEAQTAPPPPPPIARTRWLDSHEYSMSEAIRRYGLWGGNDVQLRQEEQLQSAARRRRDIEREEEIQPPAVRRQRMDEQLVQPEFSFREILAGNSGAAKAGKAVFTSNLLDGNDNNNVESVDFNDIAITATINNLGLRRA